MKFQKFFLFWEAGMILKDLELDLESSFSFGITSKITLWLKHGPLELVSNTLIEVGVTDLNLT